MTIPLRSPLGIGFDFSSAARTGGAFTLPPWLTIACATAGRSSRTGPASLVTGLGANAARARSVDGATWGLSVESARTNFALRSQTVGSWLAGGGVVVSNVNGHAGPDGNADATKIAWASPGDAVLPSDGATGIPHFAAGVGGAFTLWLLANGATALIDLYDGGTGFFIRNYAIGSAWQLFEQAIAATHPSDIYLNVGEFSSPAGAAWLFGAQVERSVLYPSSYVPTTTGTVTRAADVLSIPSPGLVAPGGFFDMTITVAPNYATAEQGADHDLLFFDANNRVYLQQSSSKIVLRIGGANVLSSTLTWSREQALTVHASHTAAGRTLTVSGATSGNGTATAGAAGAISLPATAYMLGNASGAEECSDLRNVVFV